MIEVLPTCTPPLPPPTRFSTSPDFTVRLISPLTLAPSAPPPVSEYILTPSTTISAPFSIEEPSPEPPIATLPAVFPKTVVESNVCDIFLVAEYSLLPPK